MQRTNFDRVKILVQAIADVIKEQRKSLSKSQRLQRLFADEFEMQKSLLSRLENANNEPKIGSLWMISEAFGLKPSEFFKLVEQKLPKDFKILD